MSPIPNCSKSIGILVLSAIALGIAQFSVYGNIIPANKVCLNASDGIICYFKGSETPVNWTVATNLCRFFNSTLPVIRNENDQDLVAGYLKSHLNNTDTWTAGKIVPYSAWRWINGDSLIEEYSVKVVSNDEIKYTNWDNAFATDGECIFIAASEGKWKAIACNQFHTAVCQRGQGVTSPTANYGSDETIPTYTYTLFAAVGVGIIIFICIILIVVFVMRTKNGRRGLSKHNDGYVQNNGEELETRISNAPVYTSKNEPSDVPVNRPDDMRGVYADITLLTPEQSEDGGTDQQPGTVYVSLDFNKDSTNMDSDKTISHPTFPTKVGPLGDIYAIPDARGHAVTSPGEGSASRPVKVTPQGDVYAIPMKISPSPTTFPPVGAVYANLIAATLDKEQMAEDNGETK